jgi:hypothetical protein
MRAVKRSHPRAPNEQLIKRQPRTIQMVESVDVFVEVASKRLRGGTEAVRDLYIANNKGKSHGSVYTLIHSSNRREILTIRMTFILSGFPPPPLNIMSPPPNVANTAPTNTM